MNTEKNTEKRKKRRERHLGDMGQSPELYDRTKPFTFFLRVSSVFSVPSVVNPFCWS